MLEKKISEEALSKLSTQDTIALSFYWYKMILDHPNNFDWVPIVLDGSNSFWSGPYHFEIIKISPAKSNLNLTQMICTWPEQFAPDQNNFYSSKTIWTVQNHFGTLEGQSKWESIKISDFDMQCFGGQIWLWHAKFFVGFF